MDWKVVEAEFQVSEERAPYGWEAGGHRDLRVWREAMDLAEATYRLTESFPKNETYGLASQMKRAAVSVPSNIAEGSGRKSPADFSRFVSIALGSLRELETQALLAKRLELAVVPDSYFESAVRLARMLFRFQQHLDNLRF